MVEGDRHDTDNSIQQRRIAILSDLHANTYEHRGTDPITSLGLHGIVNDTLDALIIAGDLADGPAPRWIRGLALLTPHVALERIYVMPGNYDYYGGTLSDDHLLAEHARSVGAHYVQKEELHHGDTRILCCTMLPPQLGFLAIHIAGCAPWLGKPMSET